MRESKNAYEYPYERERRPRKKSGAGGKIVALLLGFVLGITAAVGGVAGVGYWIYSRPLEKTVNTADKFLSADLYALLFGSTDENGNPITGYLSSDYAEKSVKELVGDIAAAAKALSDNGNLAALDAISPKVGKAVDSLLKQFEKYNMPLNRDELLSKPLKSSDGQETLLEYFENSIKATAAGDFFAGLGSKLSPLLLALCYGEEGINYEKDGEGNIAMLDGFEKNTLGDLLSEDMSKIMNKVPVEAVLKVKPTDGVLCALAYGTANRYTVKDDGSIEMTQVAYTAELADGALTLYDDQGEPLVAAATELSENFYAVELTTEQTDENGKPITETQYVEVDPETGVGLAYKDECKQTVLRYRKVTVGGLQEDSKAIVNNIYLKDAMNITASSHKVLISLAYGEYGADYKYVEKETTGENGETVVTKEIEMLGNAQPRTVGDLRKQGSALIDSISLTDVLNEDRDDKIVMYLLYGKQDIHYSIDPETDELKMLQKRVAVLDGLVYDEYGEPYVKQEGETNGYVLDAENGAYTDETGVTYYYDPAASFGTVKIGETTNEETGEKTELYAPLYYLTDENGEAVYYKKTSLGDLSGANNPIAKFTDRLTCGEIFGDDAKNNKFLKHLTEKTISELPAAVENLTIQQVFGTDIYKTDGNGNFVDAENNVTQDPEKYVLNREWWYLLHNEEDCKAAEHQKSHCECISDFKITDMNALIDDMKNNIHLSTLQQLADDGMMQFTQNTLDSDLKNEIRYGKESGQTIPIHVTVNGEKKYATEVFEDKNGDGLTVGDMTVEEMILYVDGIMNAIEKLDEMFSTN